MKKLFISCPMRGRSNEAIYATMEQMHRIAEAVFNEELEVIQTHCILNEPLKDANLSLWRFGNSIQYLACADYFIGVYDSKREFKGCVNENRIASDYGIPSYLINVERVAPDVADERDTLFK